MATDLFIKIDGIKGESTDKGHKEEIEVLSFSHGVSQMAPVRSTAGGGTGERCSHQDFSFAKLTDKATPLLNKFVCKGDHIPMVHFYCRRASGAGPIDYMVYEMKDVVITSYSISGASEVPMENISLNYGSIKWTYTEADDKDGKIGAVEATWSLLENAEM
jgi:type VI secretion system secreted protein Hcp